MKKTQNDAIRNSNFKLRYYVKDEKEKKITSTPPLGLADRSYFRPLEKKTSNYYATAVSEYLIFERINSLGCVRTPEQRKISADRSIHAIRSAPPAHVINFWLTMEIPIALEHLF